MRVFNLILSLIMTIVTTINLCYGSNFDGLIAYYPFDGNAQDRFGNHGDIHGAVSDFDRFGKENSCFRFDGKNDYIEIDSIKNVLTNDNDITICGWFKTSNNPTFIWGHILFSVNGKNLSNHFRIGTSKNGSIFLSAYEGNDLTYKDSYNDNKWHFIVVMLKKNGDLYCYVDNILLSAVTNVGIIDWESVERASFGQEWDPEPEIISDFWYGCLDDFMIFNRLLNKDEIEKIFYEVPCTIDDTDEDGVPDIWDNCINTPLNSYIDKNGCRISGLYTEEQMNQMVISILSWGDFNGDQRIGLEEVIRTLRISSGVIDPAVK